MQVDIQAIRQAREKLKPVIRDTEIDLSLSLTQRAGCDVYLKFENQQYTGSFKLRGAYNKISSLTAEERARGVIACSAGNHAQGVALSATKAGVKSRVVMPKGAPLIKVEATRGYGAEVVLYGDIFDEALEKAREMERAEGLVFVHPYEDPLIIAGQGTLGLEILEAIPDLDSVIVPVGGGGMISGIGIAIKTLRPQCRVIGVQSAQAPGMAQLFRHETVSSPKILSTIADGIAIKRPSQLMYDKYISKYVDELVTVTDDQIAEAIVILLERAKTVTEGSGAAGVAALLHHKLNLGKKTCVILCGGNIDLNMVAKVIEKGQIQRGRLAQLSVVVDDLPGNLNKLTRLIAEQKANVLEVHHDRISQGLYLRETRIDFVLETRNQEHIDALKIAMLKEGCRIL